MVTRIFAAAGFIAAGCAATAAEDLSGRYKVNGTLANGRTYSNWAVIKMSSENTCDITWSDGTKGVCMLNGTTLSYASVILPGLPGGEHPFGEICVKAEPQVGVYQVAPDGSMEGAYFDNTSNKGGHEKLTPVR
ncbi:hypothetical protein [Sinorhizobium sp. BG8]|uniref:hypothetical protein n=1 Tax=Sinorhizobium sp. BG8 TaxID=2613773 RepID=UPI00193DA74D|nr:hypothetical protein [Sinorhizobium sp. BG8]QRM54927.1 hypothetical protein F3Y30_10515 [Sinorhizobium sp. BG8]